MLVNRLCNFRLLEAVLEPRRGSAWGFGVQNSLNRIAHFLHTLPQFHTVNFAITGILISTCYRRFIMSGIQGDKPDLVVG